MDKISKAEKLLIEKIKEGDEEAFEKLFFEYYAPLCKYALKIVKSQVLAQDAVQEVFMKVWKSHENWDVYHSINTYLYQAVRNQSLDILEAINKQRDISRKLFEEKIGEKNSEGTGDNPDYVTELIEGIWNIAETMPKRRKTVFTLHRRNGLSYKEIATVMGIKRKSVENHMALALKNIRDGIDLEKLDHYQSTMHS
jgi:RNA polymerase sigma-70 factor (ECF subfamily)